MRVAYDDGSVRDLSRDSRVDYSTPDAGCASVAAGATSNSVTIASGASCVSVVVVATVQLGSFVFVANHTRPVVYVGRMSLSFSGYPDVSANRALEVTTLGLVPCLSSFRSPSSPPPPSPPPPTPYYFPIFANTMVLTLLIRVGDIDLATGTLTAFAGSEIRGVQYTSTLAPFGPFAGKSMFAITVYADNSGETITFTFFDGNVVINLDQTRTFVVNGGEGTAISPGMFGGPSPWGSVYFHATAAPRVHLTDDSSYDVTAQSSFESSHPLAVFIATSSSTRMQAKSAGSSTISATFGARTTVNRDPDGSERAPRRRLLALVERARCGWGQPGAKRLGVDAGGAGVCERADPP